MDDPKRIYELLLDYCSTDAIANNILIGSVWTVCQSENNLGLCMSPAIPNRSLSWSGNLAGKSIIDVAAGITEWEPFRATVAMAAVNCCINSRPLPESLVLDNKGKNANLAVFEYFLPQLTGKNVVVIGHYPGIEQYKDQVDLKILEKQLNDGDYPDAACEFLIPSADWVFITASSIPNKTFPRLAELASDAKTVLMGPTTPWLPQLHEFGIDFLAGVEITDTATLSRTIAEGGGKLIFSNGLRYRLTELSASVSLDWLKKQIAECFAEKIKLTEMMEDWYNKKSHHRFPRYVLLEQINNRLSRMDSAYKSLADK